MKRLDLGIISIDGQIVFAKDDFESDEYTDVYKTEYNMSEYILKISYSNPPTPIFTLFRRFTNENKRRLHDLLCETSKLWKVERYIKNYLL